MVTGNITGRPYHMHNTHAGEGCIMQGRFPQPKIIIILIMYLVVANIHISYRKHLLKT